MDELLTKIRNAVGQWHLANGEWAAMAAAATVINGFTELDERLAQGETLPARWAEGRGPTDA